MRLLLTVLCLAGTAPQLHAQELATEPVPIIDTAQVRPLTINEKRAQRGLSNMKTLFVPKGQWVFGGTASYSTHSNDNYRFLIIEDINSEGYNVKVSPLVAYAVADNMAVGARFTYGRRLMKLDKAHLQLGEGEDGTEISANDFYTLTHSYTGSVIWRQYLPLGRSRRFALFNEMSLSAGGSQAKFANDSPVKGTYQTGFEIGLGISPGIIAFATNNMAVEVSVGVMGINYTRLNQVHNQVHEGKVDASSMSFRINIFSVGLGLAFYL